MINTLKLTGYALLLAFVVGCGSSATQDQQEQATPAKKEAAPINFAIKTAQTIAPKDTLTPPEQGGYGFEQIAEKEGFVTYLLTPEELKFFGDARATKGGQITRVMPRFPASMRTEGQNAGYVENTMIQTLMYEGLLDMHPVTLEYTSNLASHWKISADKMRYWFRINPDARWSDGEPLTADDVIATWDLHMDETILSPSDQLTYGKLERPVAEGKYIVSVKAKELNWRNLLYFGTMPIYPHHVLKDLTGTEYLEQFQFKMLPCTGPYTLLENDIQTQKSYALTRRLDFWDAENPMKKYMFNFDKIKFEVVKDNDALEYEKLKKGEADFYFELFRPRRWAEETNFDAVQKGWVQKREVYSQKPSENRGLCFNMRKAPFNDKRVRQAFCYLIDREKMNKEMFFSLYEMQNSRFSGSVYENPTNEQIACNPEKAAQLLAEAGWKERNADGWLINAKGQPLRIELSIPKVYEERMTPIQEMYKQYGIDLQIKFVDQNTEWKLKMDRSFDIGYERWGGLLFPNPETSFLSKLADQNDNNNLYGFKNKRVDEICALYDKEFDAKKRIEQIREVDKIVCAEYITAPLFYQPTEWLLFWDRYGYPEYMVDRYLSGGIEELSILKLWWFDPAKSQRLDEAIAKGESLPVGEAKATFWRDYMAANKDMSGAGK